ncbi:MAG TPA: amino acid ABC transporter substrate-binding protein [Candidatus Limiplasma sp.]|jgi:polar amino acid transport system substrate-binding protein|nr:amino acid ABC transporter substrate-binding protein [Candidatus Limiplasma sp.]
MMKKLKSILALTLALMLCAVSFAAFAEDDSLQKVKDKGQFVLGFDASFPPMGFTDENGSYVGFDIDVAREVCARLGVELVLQPIDWSAKDLELSSGNIDCIWNGMTVTDERKESMSLSVPYLNNAQVLCVKADSDIKTIADMKGKKLALQSGSSAAEAVAANADLLASLDGAPVEYSDNTLALMDLDNGGVDAVALDVIVANYYIAKKGANYRVLDEQLAPEQYAVGFRKGDLALTDAVNQQLFAMAKDGKLAEISTEWFGSDVTIVAQQEAAQ